MLKSKPLVLEGLTKRYADTVAVQSISLEVPAGEFLTLLGPSGCGKTTLLRMIAGLEIPTAGRIMLGGEEVTHTPVNRRDTSIMFQDYALFPHKTVLDNIAFGLKVRGIPRNQREARAREVLEFIKLPQVAQRRPAELSGGQRQRVALARSLIVEPAVLLLDEPLGALDANLRQHMQIEIKRIQRELGLTFISVTHDQQEAMTMSDRIVVMRDGSVEQIGVPEQIYHTPRTTFVAQFIGHCNVIEAVADYQSDGSIVCTHPDFGTLRVDNPWQVAHQKGEMTSIAVRPERVRIDPEAGAFENVATATVVERIFMGAMSRLMLRLASGALVYSDFAESSPRTSAGGTVSIGWNRADSLVLF